MIDNVKRSGAGTIGLTLYPTYPEGSFKNKGMYPYGYQNGGDWTWFGGRMIKQLYLNGFKKEAYEQLKPMLKRVIDNKDFTSGIRLTTNQRAQVPSAVKRVYCMTPLYYLKKMN